MYVSTLKFVSKLFWSMVITETVVYLLKQSDDPEEHHKGS